MKPHDDDASLIIKEIKLQDSLNKDFARDLEEECCALSTHQPCDEGFEGFP